MRGQSKAKRTFRACSADSCFSTILRPAGADPTLRSGLLAERHPGASSIEENVVESKNDGATVFLCVTIVCTRKHHPCLEIIAIPFIIVEIFLIGGRN